MYTDERRRADKVTDHNDNRQFDRLDLRVRDGPDGMGPRTGHAAARIRSLKIQTDRRFCKRFQACGTIFFVLLAKPTSSVVFIFDIWQEINSS